MKHDRQAAAVAFCSGFGRSDTHALRLDVGTPDERDNPHPDAGKPYGTITGADVAQMVADPPAVEKDRARWFIPSTYAGHDARGHGAQREHGQFWWLVLDLDRNDPALSDVAEAVAVVVGADVPRLIHSSRSATAEDRRWRALIPLAEPIAGADYSDTLAAFNDLIERTSAGVLIPDRALERPGQIVFLPNRGVHYEPEIHRGHRGQRLRLTAEHPIIRQREESRAHRLVSMAENEQSIRREDVRHTNWNDTLKIGSSVFVSLGLIGAGVYCGIIGQPWLGGVLGTSGVVAGIVQSYLRRRS